MIPMYNPTFFGSEVVELPSNTQTLLYIVFHLLWGLETQTLLLDIYFFNSDCFWLFNYFILLC